jgi:hypothetical protein
VQERAQRDGMHLVVRRELGSEPVALLGEGRGVGDAPATEVDEPGEPVLMHANARVAHHWQGLERSAGPVARLLEVSRRRRDERLRLARGDDQPRSPKPLCEREPSCLLRRP